jgi:hypothetical protein
MNVAPLASSYWPDIGNKPHPYTNVYLDNNVNIIERMATIPKETIIRNLTMKRFEYGTTRPNGMPTTPMDIIREFPTASNNANAVVKSRLEIHMANGESFEYFMPEQHPDYVMLERIYPKDVRPALQNCPTPGLTNQQCMLTHGVATLGRVATCVQTREGIQGFVCPI